MKRAALAVLGLVALGGCRRATTTSDAGPVSVTTVPEAKPIVPRAERVAFDLVRSVDQCAFGLRGPLLDLGERGTRVRGPVGEELDEERVEREGASFARVREKSITLPFYLDADEERVASTEPTTITVRARGASAKAAAVYVNGKPAGAVRFAKNETASLAATAPTPLLVVGMNEVSLRFQGGSKTDKDVMAEVDWIHVGSREPDKTFAAPTVREVIVDRAAGTALQKAFALRGETYVRCMGLIPDKATLEFDLAAEGGGDVEIEARLVRDRMPDAILGRATGKKTFAPQKFELAGKSAGTVGAVELSVLRVPKGGRALFGSPRVVLPPPPQRPAADPVKGVLLVVFGTVDPKSLTSMGGALGAEGVAVLAREGTVFTGHRNGSTLPNATVGAMLTGHGARTLRLEDGEARLPAAVTTVSDAARQAGVVTAMFTGNPMTTAAFGFARSWETLSPLLTDGDPSGTRPFEEAAAWIRARKDERFLAVVHARGGHPPWAVTPEQLKAMPPEAYAGGLDAKHAGELLSKARHVPPLLRFSDADRTRAFALHAHAVAEQDRALAKLLGELRSNGTLDKTLVVFTSDVGVNNAAVVPFGDGESPNEQLLASPLVIRGRGFFPAGATVTNPTQDLDVAKTVLLALGLTPPNTFEGVDLADVVAGVAFVDARPRFATVLGRHSLRWGSLVLETSDRRESLCDVALEPSCTTDVRSTHPLALFILGRRLARERTAPPLAGIVREPAQPDAHLQALLRAWGR